MRKCYDFAEWLSLDHFHLRVSFLKLRGLKKTKIHLQFGYGSAGMACVCFRWHCLTLLDEGRRIQDVLIHTAATSAEMVGLLAFLSSPSWSLIPQSFSSLHGLSFTSNFFIRLPDSKEVKWKLAGLVRPRPRPGKVPLLSYSIGQSKSQSRPYSRGWRLACVYR